MRGSSRSDTLHSRRDGSTNSEPDNSPDIYTNCYGKRNGYTTCHGDCDADCIYSYRDQHSVGKRYGSIDGGVDSFSPTNRYWTQRIGHSYDASEPFYDASEHANAHGDRRGQRGSTELRSYLRFIDGK